MNPRTKQGRAELRALCEKATPGPLILEEVTGGDAWLYGQRRENDWIGNMKYNDAACYAAARTALPAALDALDALDAAEAVIEAARAFDGPVHSDEWPAARLRLHLALAAYDKKAK